MIVTWCQPRSQSRTGASVMACQAGCRRASATSQTAVTGSRQAAAARLSRTAGQPRSHAATYPATTTSVTGHAATAAAASSSHLVTLTILRSSHRHAVSLSHAQTLIAAAPG
jgi:hypothetical protein